MADFGALYREHVADVSALAADLTDEELAVVVPATPLWTVRQVFCHMAGGAHDQLTDRMDGAPSPEWTARHVGERVDLPVADVIGELRANQESVAGTLAGNPFPAAAFDISVHHADLHEALGKPRMAEDLWLPVLDAMRPRLDLSLFDAAPDYEVYRGLFSRRSRAQMQAWGTALSADELDGMTVFGPREDDQPIPV